MSCNRVKTSAQQLGCCKAQTCRARLAEQCTLRDGRMLRMCHVCMCRVCMCVYVCVCVLQSLFGVRFIREYLHTHIHPDALPYVTVVIWNPFPYVDPYWVSVTFAWVCLTCTCARRLCLPHPSPLDARHMSRPVLGDKRCTAYTSVGGCVPLARLLVSYPCLIHRL